MLTRRGFIGAAGAVSLAAQDRRKIRLAIVGAGNRARIHMQGLQAVPDFEIVAIADPTAEARDRAASITGAGVKLFADYRQMFAEVKNIDAVMAIVPNFLHADVSIAALAHGYHVLSEKPMATSVEDADRMIAAAEKAGKILMIGQQNRYRTLNQKVVDLIRAGEIGPVQLALGNTFRGDWNSKSWRYTDPKTGTKTNWRFLTHTAGSSLCEDGIHEIDVLHWMIGSRVARIFASGGNNVLKGRETIDHAALVVEYESGAKMEFGFCLFGTGSGPVGRLMALIGSEGSIQMEEGKIALRKKGDEPRMIDVAEPPVKASASGPKANLDPRNYRLHLAFAESIRTGRQPLTSGHVGKEAVKICLLAEKSLRERRIVTWNDLPG